VTGAANQPKLIVRRIDDAGHGGIVDGTGLDAGSSALVGKAARGDEFHVLLHGVI
jgi:hypothetical protein